MSFENPMSRQEELRRDVEAGLTVETNMSEMISALTDEEFAQLFPGKTKAEIINAFDLVRQFGHVTADDVRRSIEKSKGAV